MLNMPAPDKQFAADMQLEIEKWKKEKSSNFLFSDAINIFSGIITYHDMPEMILNTCLNPKKTYEEKIRSSYSKDKAKYIIENSNPKIIKAILPIIPLFIFCFK